MDETTSEALEQADEAALRRIRTVAGIMDDAVRVPGTNYTIGLDPIVGVLPGGGDLVAAGVSLYIVAEAAYLGVPFSTVVKMLGTVGLDFAAGSVPLVGTVFDMFWKANTRNVATIEEYLERRGSDGDTRGKEPISIDVSESE